MPLESKQCNSPWFISMTEEDPTLVPQEKYEYLRMAIGSTVLFVGFLGAKKYYNTFLRRIPNTQSLPQRFLRQRALLGKVTSVGDGDNFHFFHTPGGYLAGWGWLRSTPKVNTRGLKDQTIHIRLCGVDAPECSHFGRPGQPYGPEALEWLRKYILGRRVRVVPLSKDQYGRTVGDAKVWKLTGPKNISAEMLKNGWAVVYDGKVGAEFNGKEEKFRKLEEVARKRRLGQFHSKGKVETPAEYKAKYRSN